ncbi:MAG: hypothetical protein CMB55_07290 [Euryarchaeota archaeon]|nr:hypothetical protein [Euryarchaeota archaeon]|tara:strand:+ start:195 stop:704 length:510 start_codon:yes stop_codon:yes gene_type:complete
MLSKYEKRLSVSQSIDFNLTTNELWNLISAPGNLNSSHPFCKINEIISWEKGDYSDRLVYLNGRNYVRDFQSWEEGKGYTLLIGKENGAQSFVRWEIEEQDDGSKLTITVYPFILAKLPKILAFIPHILWVRPRLGNYLKSVLSGFKHFSMTGENVPRNHFGKHPWFSD